MKKLLSKILSCLVCVSASVSAVSSVSAADNRLNNMWSHPQEKSYWCGYSAMQSVVQHEVSLGNVSGRKSKSDSLSQTEIANFMKDNYGINPYVNNIDNDGSLPWYSGSKNVDTNQCNYYPGRALNKITDKDSYAWRAYGCSTTGVGELDYKKVKEKVKYAIDKGHGVLACGRSNPNGTSYIPGYPTDEYVVHWLAIDGYKNDGNRICIIDTGAGSPVSGLGNVSRYYTLSIENFTDFAWYHGIVW